MLDEKSVLGRNEAVLNNLHLVRIIATQVSANLPIHKNFDDLVQDGAVGLIDSAEKYDSEMPNKFSTYASVRVRGAMLDGLRSADWATRDMRRHKALFARTKRDLGTKLMRSPTQSEVAEELGVDDEVLRGWACERENVSLSAVSDMESPEACPSSLCEAEQLHRFLDVAMAQLPVRHRQVVVLYFSSEMTMLEIAGILGVVESRVSQLLKSSMEKMRRSLESAGVKSIRDLG